LATIVAIVVARETISQIFHNFRKNIAFEIFKNGWPIAISGAFGMVMLNIDIFMLGIWRTTTEIGLYVAGQKIIQVIFTIPALLASGIFPTLSSIVKTGNKEQENNLNEKSILLVFILTIPLIVGGFILAEPLLKFIFGLEYTQGVSAFKLLLLGTIFLFPGIMIANLVLAHNQQKKVFKYVITATCMNVILNFILIPKIGIIGAALATLIAQIINYGFTWNKMNKISPFKIFPHLNKIVISTVIMGIVSFILNTFELNVLLNITISVCLYLILLYVLKEKTFHEIKEFIKNLKAVDINQEIV
jgi:stage V sporulation protein B